MNKIDILHKFGSPFTFDEIEKTKLNEPPTTFYLLKTHFETALPIEEVVRRLDSLFEDNDKIPFRVTIRGTDTVINDTGFSWKTRQEKIPEEYCDELSDETYCSTSVNLYKKKSCPGTFIVEAVRLNGNHNMFQNNWREIQTAFDIESCR